MGGEMAHSFPDVVLNLLIYFGTRMGWNAIKRAGHHALLHVKKEQCASNNESSTQAVEISEAGR
jgi:hypothetical protein